MRRPVQLNNKPLPFIKLITNFYQEAKAQKKRPTPLKKEDYTLIHTILDACRDPLFNGISISNLLLAIAYRGTQWHDLEDEKNEAGSLDQRLLNVIKLKFENLSFRNVANIVWALIMAGLNWQDLKEKKLDQGLLEAIKRKAEEFGPHDIANVLWALMTAGLRWEHFQQKELDSVLIGAIKRNAPHLNPKNVANILWALITAGLRWENLVSGYLNKPLVKAIKRNAKGFGPSATVNILWALVKADLSWEDLKNKDLDKRLVEAIKRNAKDFSPQHIANILWALAKADLSWEDLKKEGLDKQLVEAIKRNAKGFSPQHIASILWALITAGLRWEDLEAQELDGPLLEVIKRNADADDWDLQAIGSVLWALAKVGLNEQDWKEQGLDKIFLERIEKSQTEPFETQQINQIEWSRLWFDLQLTEATLHRIQEIKSTIPPPESSQLHLAFSEQLKKQVVTFENEYQIEGAIYVDIFIPSMRLVIEIDGPTHIPENDHFKDSLLLKLGYKVERVSFRDKANFEQIITAILKKYSTQPKPNPLKENFLEEKSPAKPADAAASPPLGEEKNPWTVRPPRLGRKPPPLPTAPSSPKAAPSSFSLFAPPKQKNHKSKIRFDLYTLLTQLDSYQKQNTDPKEFITEIFKPPTENTMLLEEMIIFYQACKERFDTTFFQHDVYFGMIHRLTNERMLSNPTIEIATSELIKQIMDDARAGRDKKKIKPFEYNIIFDIPFFRLLKHKRYDEANQLYAFCDPLGYHAKLSPISRGNPVLFCNFGCGINFLKIVQLLNNSLGYVDITFMPDERLRPISAKKILETYQEKLNMLLNLFYGIDTAVSLADEGDTYRVYIDIMLLQIQISNAQRVDTQHFTRANAK